jgi:A/G-specific adenine glycosylase
MNVRRALSVPESDVSSVDPFAVLVVRWQRQHGRHDLPWQVDRSPYRVWLSEIMLQQTQVTTVIPYFERFVARFPDVGSLAAAPIEAVLALWAGLGYYARARNLHACTRQIIERFGGRFPETVADLSSLPGIGRSTAGAIAALAFGQRAPILDGNVKRVLSRQFAIDGPVDQPATQRALWARAERLLPGADDIRPYTQGLMDLGATVCTRAQPRCEACPVQAHCIARHEGLTAAIPARRLRKALPLRETCLLLADDGQRLLFERRPSAGLWGGLLSLPESDADGVADALRGLGLTPLGPPDCRVTFVHGFTHFRLRILALHVSVGPVEQAAEGGRLWLPAAEALALGVPAPVARILRDHAGS